MAGTLQFRVDGEPRAQPRHSTVTTYAMDGTKSTRGYTKGPLCKVWKRDLTISAQQAMRDSEFTFPINAPVVLSISFFMHRPQRLNRKCDPEGVVPHISKPDLDNLEKAVMDACTKAGVWKDDRLVWTKRTLKVYHPKGGSKGMLVTIGWGGE